MSPFWQGKKVFITGHTGFKGGWLAYLLSTMGAQVSGYALQQANDKGFFYAVNLADKITHQVGDIRDLKSLHRALEAAQPDVVFHLAAQSILSGGFLSPLDTLSTNVMGTAGLLQLLRSIHSVRTVVVVTSDKCYANEGAGEVFTETSRLGGDDPYSASKACAELVTNCFYKTFLSERDDLGVATVRAGNVIAGGDWAAHRLVPDVMRALISHGVLSVRVPEAIRPWQFVLEPLRGYVMLAEQLWQAPRAFSGAWNFGPDEASHYTVRELVERITQLWQQDIIIEQSTAPSKEQTYLRLDSSKARERLQWRPLLSLEDALAYTVAWYRRYAERADMEAVTQQQIEAYDALARSPDLSSVG